MAASALSLLQAERLARLAVEARISRTDWLDASSAWQAGPHRITKAEVLTALCDLRACDLARATGPPCPLRALGNLADVAAAEASALATSSGTITAAEVAVAARERTCALSRTARLASWSDARVQAAPLIATMVRPQTEEEAVACDPAYALRARLRDPSAADAVDSMRRLVRGVLSWDITAMHDAHAARCGDPDAEYDDDVPRVMRGREPRAALASPASATQMQTSDSTGGSVSSLQTTTAPAPLPPAPAAPLEDPGEAVRSALSQLEGRLRSHPLWRGLGGEAWESVCTGLEKLFFLRVASTLFCAPRRSAARDARLAERLRALQFLEVRNLDLPTDMPAWTLPVWHVASAALLAADSFAAPGDKVECIMNCCRTLSTLLTFFHAEVRGKDAALGADDFLPALILAVLRAAPPRLVSNLRFITDYVRPNVLMTQSGYFVTNVISAVAFLRHARPEQLSLSQEVFDAGIAAASALAASRSKELQERAAPSIIETAAAVAVAAAAKAVASMSDADTLLVPATHEAEAASAAAVDFRRRLRALGLSVDAPAPAPALLYYSRAAEVTESELRPPTDAHAILVQYQALLCTARTLLRDLQPPTASAAAASLALE